MEPAQLIQKHKVPSQCQRTQQRVCFLFSRDKVAQVLHLKDEREQTVALNLLAIRHFSFCPTLFTQQVDKRG